MDSEDGSGRKRRTVKRSCPTSEDVTSEQRTAIAESWREYNNAEGASPAQMSVWAYSRRQEAAALAAAKRSAARGNVNARKALELEEGWNISLTIDAVEEDLVRASSRRKLALRKRILEL